VLEISDLIAWRGALVSSSVVKDIGFPEKDFFLYAGDIEYGLRMRKAGYKIYLVLSSRIESLELSPKHRSKFFIKTELYKQPFRVYYAYRNELMVFLRYRMRREACRFVLRGIVNICFSILSGRFAQAAAIIRGITDAFRNKLGKVPRYLP